MNINDKPSAIQYGRTIFEQSIVHRCLVIWVDASVHKFPPTKRASRLSASAVRYLDPSSKRWKESVTFNTLPYGSRFAAEAEFIAIHEAFRVAFKITDEFDRLIIFSDCQQVLQDLRAGSRLPFLTKTEMLGSLLAFANCMYDLGIAVELRWVPSHSGVEGNERVDELAKQLRRSGQSILAQKSPLRNLSNITVSAGSLESLRQALVENITQTTHGTEGNSNKVDMEASIEFEKLTGQASPPPCIVRTVSVLN
ncbi:hypothetical protein P153DRAFT_411527 [Dothidotthia symphoricarpi CBS 119687]|uniref:RNase H type-1 domain-containing protein n=1 Tax=Dothidotthia symphoricarpi CBS 119687 TaxID=1392245 RepID=A0A6A6A005_9PLEO|nr:uncharacterized protein P153DRAFT_411527 [Dothidotthia symphoricarpi CBS 119687]KAF2124483.1 hypothetical protein P153DRAFT_411527 [Dothidotthia symphoricarpi CBS 119687]